MTTREATIYVGPTGAYIATTANADGTVTVEIMTPAGDARITLSAEKASELSGNLVSFTEGPES
jgi:hypothetical protein